MKKTNLFFVLVAIVALAVGFSSCSNDDENSSLIGSTWVGETRGDGWTRSVTLTFFTEFEGEVSIMLNNSSGRHHSGGYFSYTFDYPTVSITTIRWRDRLTGVITGRRTMILTDMYDMNTTLTRR